MGIKDAIKVAKEGKKLRNSVNKEFYELKQIFKLINKAEDEKSKGEYEKVKSGIKKILKKRGKEEGKQKRMEKAYDELENFLKNVAFHLPISESDENHIKELLKKAKEYNEDLDNLVAKKGDLENKLNSSENDPNQLDAALEDIKKAFQDIEEYEKIVNQLHDMTKSLLSQFDKKKNYPGIEITGFEGDAHPDMETEYFINFKISGKIDNKPFEIGESDEEKMVHGAMKFRDVDHLIEEMRDYIDEETLQKDKSKGAITKLKEDDFIEIYEIILEKLKEEKNEELEEFREECNKTAEEMDRQHRMEFG